MASSKVIERDKVREKRRFDKRDHDMVVEQVMDTFSKRSGDADRQHREREWKEIDRQLKMEPDLARKMENGQAIAGTEWLSEMELPLQAQTLEVLTADARRMMLPDDGPFFKAHSALTDAYLDRADFNAIVAGDENEVPSQINQDNADKLVEGFMDFNHKAGDFGQTWDQLNAEAFKYGTFAARAVMVERSLFRDTARGTIRKREKIPTLVPLSIRHTYLDDTKHVQWRQGFMVGPSQIYEEHRSYHDLMMAGNKGNTDPDDFIDGGWIPAGLSRLENPKDGDIKLIEMEGDIIVPRESVNSMYLPNVIATVAVGADRQLVRLRFSPHPWSSYITQPYHIEDAMSPYGVSPLMKGRPLQASAVDLLNRIHDIAALNAEPPLKYDPTDIEFAIKQGPRIQPRQLIEGLGEVEVLQIGDINAAREAYINAVNLYFDVTGVNAPRLGAQTKSHTTAFAKDVEDSRGQARTVDYVRSVLQGPMVKWLHMHFEMARDFRGSLELYIPSYGGWVNIEKKHLPDRVVFDVFGAGGPADEAQKLQRMFAAAQQAVQLEIAARQTGQTTGLDFEALNKEIMRRGGWTDLDAFFPAAGASGGVPGAADAGGQVSPALVTSAVPPAA